MKRTRRFRKFFVKEVLRRFPEEANTIIATTDERFGVIAKDTAFAARSGNPMDRRLDFSAYFLALIQTLEQKGLSYAEIRDICLSITYDYVSPKNRFHAWVRQVVPKLLRLRPTRFFIRRLNNKLRAKGNDAGFRAEIITNRQQTYGLGYGIDILECGICKLFQKYDAHAYVFILCEVDKVTSSIAGLELICQGTIAHGAPKCDFRFIQKNSKNL